MSGLKNTFFVICLISTLNGTLLLPNTLAFYFTINVVLTFHMMAQDIRRISRVSDVIPVFVAETKAFISIENELFWSCDIHHYGIFHFFVLVIISTFIWLLWFICPYSLCQLGNIVDNVDNIEGLVQDTSNSIATSLELLQSSTKPSI